MVRKRVGTALEEGVRGLRRPALLRDTPGGRDAAFVALATVPTAFVGLAVRRYVEDWSGSLFVVGIGLLASAIVIVLATWFAPAPAEGSHARAPAWVGALLVGVAQGAAVVPGVSRSAVTLASLLWLGVGAERAFELSFLVAIPAAIAALILESRHSFHGDEGPGAIAVAATLALVVGVGALHLLRRIVTSGKLHWFAFYLVPVAMATLAWGYARP